jgi:hypothetical protein
MMGAPMHNIVDITPLLRERAEKQAGKRKLRFVALAGGTPEDVLRAIAAAVQERRADAYRLLPSPWRERLLQSWELIPSKRTAEVVPLQSVARKDGSQY